MSSQKLILHLLLPSARAGIAYVCVNDARNHRGLATLQELELAVAIDADLSICMHVKMGDDHGTTMAGTQAGGC